MTSHRSSMRRVLVACLSAVSAMSERTNPLRPPSYGASSSAAAFQGEETTRLASHERLLTLEGEEFRSGAQAVSGEDWTAESAWWGSSEKSAARSLINGQKLRESSRDHQLKRMGNLMRRQLQPFEFSYDSEGPSLLPTPLPTPLPSPLPTPAPSEGGPTDAPTTASPTATPVPTAAPVVGVATEGPTPGVATDAPTAGSASASVLLTSSIEVTGVNEGDFENGGTQVVQFALNDVIDFVETPDDVVDATVTILSRRRRLTVVQRRQLLQATGNNTALIDYVVLLVTPGSNGFSSADEALESMEAQVSAAADSGELQERLAYWANYFNSPFSPEVPTPLPDGNGSWVFAPTAMPTPVSFPPSGTKVPTASPAPSTTPKPSVTFAPTSAPPTGSPAPSSSPVPTATFKPTFPAPTTPPPTPKPSVSPAPTVTPKPTLTKSPTTLPSDAPSTFAPTQIPTAAPNTAAPVVPRGTGGKSSSSSSGVSSGILILIIILCIVAFIVLCGCCWWYQKQRERKMTERKDSWDISTMFTDEANLPDAEEINVEPEVEGGVDEADGAEGGVIVAGADEGAIEPVEPHQPQELQKITQAAEL